ncbi:hypothetical protein QYM36_012127 [Artemia franciscana]|uniref:Uncharacterized protein n=1 Tax=Artemia franciscana TaxID=6661 RepID=A0AA88KX83_ARTSF|nr:hypothetical protein QYM36_012127 [Artemia franciscana]
MDSSIRNQPTADGTSIVREILASEKTLEDEWISIESWNLIKKKTSKKKSPLTTLSSDARHPVGLEYAMLDKAMKKSVPADKRRGLEQKAQKVEEAARRSVYRNTNEIVEKCPK